MGYKCDCCKEEFFHDDELVFLDGEGNQLTLSERYNEWIIARKILCNICYEESI